jgi:Mrp family chromosome partitioning ATPase
VSDAVPLLESVSGTVLVAKVGATTRDALHRLRQVIETARGNVLGVVATGSAGAGLYGYGADYYQEDEGPDTSEEPSVDGVGPAATAERAEEGNGRGAGLRRRLRR